MLCCADMLCRAVLCVRAVQRVLQPRVAALPCGSRVLVVHVYMFHVHVHGVALKHVCHCCSWRISLHVAFCWKTPSCLSAGDHPIMGWVRVLLAVLVVTAAAAAAVCGSSGSSGGGAVGCYGVCDTKNLA